MRASDDEAEITAGIVATDEDSNTNSIEVEASIAEKYVPVEDTTNVNTGDNVMGEYTVKESNIRDIDIAVAAGTCTCSVSSEISFLTALLSFFASLGVTWLLGPALRVSSNVLKALTGTAIVVEALQVFATAARTLRDSTTVEAALSELVVVEAS